MYYIKAAIEAATGVKLNIDEVKRYLVEEGLATQAKVDSYTFRGYSSYFKYQAFLAKTAKLSKWDL